MNENMNFAIYVKYIEDFKCIDFNFVVHSLEVYSLE